MKNMNRERILSRVKEILQMVDDRHIDECEDDSEWSYHYDSILRYVGEIARDIVETARIQKKVK